MSTTSASPATQASSPKAPQPSAALLALQAKGLELPSTRRTSISPQSNPIHDGSLGVSPLSIVSTPSHLEKSYASELVKRRKSRRPSSAGSAETTVTNIINLYGNSSKQSLKSEYEEVTYHPDDSDDEEPPLPSFHQPKAYRDTIAPLLEHQFSGDRLTVPAMPSPMSVASMPMLMHPNGNVSLLSLDPSPQPSPNLQPTRSRTVGASQSSIQITPEMSPQPQPPAPSFQEYSQGLAERKVALEVPDVRDADSWYDQPLSPVSPEELESRLRDSQMSPISPYANVGYQRQIAFDALVPPKPKPSPHMRPVSFVGDDFLPGPIAATVTEVIDNNMMPPPLDLRRESSVSRVSERSAPVYQAEVHMLDDSEAIAPKSQHASLVTQDTLAQDPIEGPMRSYLTPPPPNRQPSTSPSKPLDLEEIYRPGSAFSDSSDSANHDKLGQFKQVWKKGFGKKDKDKSSKKQKRTSQPIAPHELSKFSDDLESYKYPYWKSHASTDSHSAIAPPHRIQSPDFWQAQRAAASDFRRTSVHSGPGPSVTASPPAQAPPTPPIRRREPQAAIPLTPYQKYGPAVWDEKLLRKQVKEEEKAKKVAEKAEKEAAKVAAKARKAAAKAERNRSIDVEGDTAGSDKLNFYAHVRPSSKIGHAHNISEPTRESRLSTDGASIATSSSRPESAGFGAARRSGGTPLPYNNDLFEASGGEKKRGGIASRLMMSSEERRKQKVKESIVVMGSSKVGGGPSGRGSGSGKALVKI